jgi:hypothetical protein
MSLSSVVKKSELILDHLKELRDGFYYGITGLITQPRYGAKHQGTKGMVKGIGKGIGGVFLKPPAGMFTLCHSLILIF